MRHLLDLNVSVSAFNHGFSCDEYLAAIDLATVGEIHLAGYTEKQLPEGSLYIDTHSAPVVEPVTRNSIARSAASRPFPP